MENNKHSQRCTFKRVQTKPTPLELIGYQGVGEEKKNVPHLTG